MSTTQSVVRADALDPDTMTPGTRVLLAQIMALLEHEAYTNLLRAAEAHAPTEAGEDGEFTRKWFGLTLEDEARATLLTLDAKRIALEIRQRAAEEDLTCAEIREDAYAKGLAQATLAHLEVEFQQLDDACGQVAGDLEARTAAYRETLVRQEAERLFRHYLALSQTLSISAYRPEVPESLRNWAREQRAKTQNPISRLYIYMMLREQVLHATSVGAPVEDTRPLRHLETLGLPRTKAEARDQAILASQFVHANGDRRVDRDTPLTRLHNARLGAALAGERFTEKLDHAERDYAGLPTLPALAPQDVEYCEECAAPVVDFIQDTTAEEHGQTGVRLVQACQCEGSLRVLSPICEDRDRLRYTLQLTALKQRRRLPAALTG